MADPKRRNMSSSSDMLFDSFDISFSGSFKQRTFRSLHSHR